MNDSELMRNLSLAQAGLLEAAAHCWLAQECEYPESQQDFEKFARQALERVKANPFPSEAKRAVDRWIERTGGGA